MKLNNKLFSTTAICLLALANHADAQEQNLKNITQLTFGGDNAEAYFSPNGKMLTMQVTNPALGAHCDQIYIYDLMKQPSQKNLELVSTGLGRTTCSFFMPDGQHVIYASTHLADKACPPKPEPRKDGKYLWPIYPEFDIFVADLKGNIVKQLTNEVGYDAEAVLSPDGKYIVFTSTRSGDLELYRMDVDGSNVKQLTTQLGYDGGAFFSPDSKKLVFRSSRPKTAEEIKEYKDLLNQGLVAPTNMEIYTMNIDGSDLKQITHLGKANWSPYFHPSGKKILFSSNHHSTKGYDFQIYSIDTDGTNLKQITYESEFNAFPMFSPDGKKLVFSSNRDGVGHETNVFIADWVDGDATENVNMKNLKKSVSYLASDKLEGRLTGSKGAELTVKYLSNALKTYGLNTKIQAFKYPVKLNSHDPKSSSTTVFGKNVIAYLDNKAAQAIVIGAHYDHLGLNQHNNSTLPNSKGQIHNGADDNASGVAAVLELARMFSQNKSIEPANYVFAFFAGEEDGLMGSKEFAEGIKSQYPNVSAMFNLDMVGRLNKDKELTVGGVGTSPIFPKLIEQYKPAGMNVALDSSGVGPSDHTSFYLKDIPVMFMFSGTHTDYHKPSDDENKINYEGMKLITEYVFNLSNALSNEKEIPFTKTKMQQGKAAPKYKVTLGIMPSYADSEDGLHIDGVMDDRPASKAGLEQGDVILKIGSCTVKNVQSYMECLSELKSGDEVPLIYKRAGKETKVMVKF
ncbi:MAG TPA: M20/M25/M40 family metallo-hydrolase [Edaphocola sp.]|nr:M20/M25/M40 family metallo-hydrolase [Edaphocola sp.]